MPYSQPSEAPQYIPEQFKAQWIKIWNKAYQSALDEGKSKSDAEAHAFSVASGVVKREKQTNSEVLATDKVTAVEAGYMELPGAVKDAGCNVVNVSGGVSSQKGCCNLYDPKPNPNAFCCGECTHLVTLDKKVLDNRTRLVYDDNIRSDISSVTPPPSSMNLEDFVSPEKIEAAKREAVRNLLRAELSEGKQDAPANPNADSTVLAADEQDYATVSGTKVHKEDFAYAPAGSKPSEWKLPIHDESHVRNALARFNQTELPADAKEAAKSKILSRAHKYGIDTSGFEGKHEKASEADTEHDGRMVWLLSDLTPMSLNGKKVVEIPICIAGTWVKGDHKFSITSKDIDSMIDNFEQRANGQTVIDYEHASEMPEMAKGGPIPAAGWMHGLRKRKISDPRSKELVDALSALVEFTPKAEEMLGNGEYRFFSPAIDWSKTDKKTGKPIGATLTSGALTNHPFLEELPPITLSDHIFADFKSDAVLATSPDAVHVNKPIEQDSKGAKKVAKKKLKLEKIASGDKAGKYGVFDDSDVLLHAFQSQKMNDAIEQMNDFEKAEILADFDNDGDDDDSAKGDTDKDAAGKDDKKEKASDAQPAEVMAEVKASEVESKPEINSEVKTVEVKKTEAQLLSECIAVPKSEAGADETAKAEFNLDEVARLAETGELKPTAFLTVNKIVSEVDKLVAEGKVLPKQKASMYRIALSDPQGFAEFAAKAEPVINTKVVGVQGGERELQKKLNDSGDATQAFMARVNELRDKNKSSFESAMREASIAHPQEYQAYVEQTLALSEKEHPALKPTRMLSSR